MVTDKKRKIREDWMAKLENQNIDDVCILPPPKKFKPKHHLPQLPDYSKPAPTWYWNLFPSNYTSPAKSMISGDKLKEMALNNGYKNYEQLDKVVKWLNEGADIGCHPLFRKPTRAKNSDSCYKDGEKISDALADWIKKGI